ncbi:MAG: hypothetical protein WAM88_12640 [Nitrososphaeraceae archaeon]
MEDLNKKQLAIYQLKWAAIYMAVTVVIMLFLPFPADFIVALFAFLVLSWYRRNQLFRKLDVDPRRDGVGSGTDFRGFKDFLDQFHHSKDLLLQKMTMDQLITIV